MDLEEKYNQTFDSLKELVKRYVYNVENYIVVDHDKLVNFIIDKYEKKHKSQIGIRSDDLGFSNHIFIDHVIAPMLDESFTNDIIFEEVEFGEFYKLISNASDLRKKIRMEKVTIELRGYPGAERMGEIGKKPKTFRGIVSKEFAIEQAERLCEDMSSEFGLEELRILAREYDVIPRNSTSSIPGTLLGKVPKETNLNPLDEKKMLCKALLQGVL